MPRRSTASNAAEQRPCRRQPALKHPAQRGAHERGNEPLTDPGMSQTLAQRQDQALRRRIHGHVSRLLDDMKALEMHPHRMGRIREPAVREGVSGQKIAELVMPARFRDAKKRNHRGARNKNEQPHDHRAEKFSSRELRKPWGKRRGDSRFSPGANQNQDQRGQHQKEFDDVEQRRREAGVESGHVHRMRGSDVGRQTQGVGLSPDPIRYRNLRACSGDRLRSDV